MKKLSLVILIFLLSTACGDDEDTCIYEGCDERRQTVKTAKRSLGTIGFFSNPDTWIIWSDGIIGSDVQIIDGPDVVVPCNFPDEFKELGLRVQFSGELKDTCDEFPDGTSVYYYSKLNEIKEITN